MGRILVVDDHDSLRKGLVRALANAGHDVEDAANGTVAIERLQDSQFDVVLTDLRMGGADGMDVLRTTRSIQPTAAVILMTAFGSIHTAVEAMKIGAFDFVQKPFEVEEMELKIEKAIELRHLKSQVEYLRDEQQDLYDFDRIVGASGALQHVSDHRQEGRAQQFDGVDPRRNGHRQGTDRRCDSSQLDARQPRVRQGELRGAAGEPARIRTVRPREGRVHERRQAAHRPLRTGRRRHPVPRRSRAT